MKPCPFCAADILETAIVCTYCQRDLRLWPTRGHWIVLGCWTIAGVRVLITFWRWGNPGAELDDTETPDAKTLRSVIVSAKESCDLATRVFRQGADVTTVFWNVACKNGRTYAVTHDRDGRARVLSCQTWKAIAHLECFVALTDHADASRTLAAGCCSPERTRPLISARMAAVYEQELPVAMSSARDGGFASATIPEDSRASVSRGGDVKEGATRQIGIFCRVAFWRYSGSGVRGRLKPDRTPVGS